MDSRGRYGCASRDVMGGDGDSWQLGVVLRIAAGSGPVDGGLPVRQPRWCRRVQHGPHVCVAAGVAGHWPDRQKPMDDECRLELDTHIAVDQVVGYGLKLPTMFEHTVLGPIGRARRDRQVVERAAT